MPLKTIEEIDSAIVATETAKTQDIVRMVRLTLARDWPRPVTLSWNRGKLGPHDAGARPEMRKINPGESVMLPMDRAMAHCGPFGILDEYENTEDEKRKADLRQFWTQELSRLLNRYGWPAHDAKNYMVHTGHNRFPDWTAEILNEDGSAQEAIRLYQFYKIGAWDPDKEKFGQTSDTPDSVKAHYETLLDQRAAEYAAKIEEFNRKQAEMAGLIKGFMVGKGQEVEA